MATRGLSPNGTLVYGSIGQVGVREATRGTVCGLGADTDELPLSATMPAPVETHAHPGLPATPPLPVVTPMSRATVLPKITLGANGEGPVLVPQDKPRYRQLSRLGEGGLGEVTLALDEDIGRPVAIKRLHDESDRGQLLRFVDEVRLTGRLDHPNIVPLHDVGCDEGGRFYFVMKRVEGETLEAIIERLRDGDPTTQQRFPLAVRIEIFLGVLRAIEFAHSHRIVHRDIKPSNIMLGRFGEVMVMDWGIAKRLDDEVSEALDAAVPAGDEVSPRNLPGRNFRTRVGALLGTPAYMSPEQARGDNHLVDERSDIYSLCVVLHELVTVRHYLEDITDLGALLDAVRTRIAPPAARWAGAGQPGVPMELSFFLERGLAKQREDRYESASEMIEALHRVVSGTFPVSCPVTLMKRGVVAVTRVLDRHPYATFHTVALGFLAWVAGTVALMIHFLR